MHYDGGHGGHFQRLGKDIQGLEVDARIPRASPNEAANPTPIMKHMLDYHGLESGDGDHNGHYQHLGGYRGHVDGDHDGHHQYFGGHLGSSNGCTHGGSNVSTDCVADSCSYSGSHGLTDSRTFNFAHGGSNGCSHGGANGTTDNLTDNCSYNGSHGTTEAHACEKEGGLGGSRHENAQSARGKA